MLTFSKAKELRCEYSRQDSSVETYDAQKHFLIDTQMTLVSVCMYVFREGLQSRKFALFICIVPKCQS